jgi:hypothetical protein
VSTDAKKVGPLGLLKKFKMPALPTALGEGGLFAPGASKEVKAPTTPFPVQSAIGTETLVDLLGLVGNALVLDNGTFLRVLEVAPVDLERGDARAKQKFWERFSNALGRLRTPVNIQIVVSTRPQDISALLAQWDDRADAWRDLAAASDDQVDLDRRAHMADVALGQKAFMVATHERLMPMQQRYLVIVPFNRFPGGSPHREQAQVLSPDTIRVALSKLEEHVSLVRATLTDIGLQLTELAPAEVCQALWDHYHHPPNVLGAADDSGLVGLTDGPLAETADGRRFDRIYSSFYGQRPKREAFVTNPLDAARLADLVAPSVIEEQADYIRVGDVVGRGYMMEDFDPRTPVDFSSLLAFRGDMTHAIYISPADPVTVRQHLKRREVELKSSQIVNARRGTVNDWGRTEQIRSIEGARAEIEMHQQPPYDLVWVAMLWANDETALERKSQDFEKSLKLMDVRFHRATRTQQAVLQSTRPLARLAYNLKARNMSAGALGPFFPFVRRQYYDPSGWYYGLHRGNGLFVALDPFEEGQSNASELVLGSPGGGKSVYLKHSIDTLLALGHRVVVIDPEREYLRMACDHHAPYIDLGKRQPDPLLPLDPDNPEGWLQGQIELGKRYEATCGRRLTERQLRALMAAYDELMNDRGLFADEPDTWARPRPKLIELVNGLRQDSDHDVRELGRVLDYIVQQAAGNVLNIMEINLDSEDPWTAAAQTLVAFVEATMNTRETGQGEVLSTNEFNILLTAYQATLKRFGILADDRSTWGLPAPHLSDLCATLRSFPEAEASALAGYLQQYTEGIYQELFNSSTSVDLSGAQFVVFGMKSLRENVEHSIAPVFAWQVLRIFWNMVVAGAAAQPIHLFVDEAWYLLQQQGAALRLEQLARSIRKYLGALHLATHDVESMLASPEAKVIATIGRVKLFFGQESDSAVKALGQVFGLTPDEQADLLTVQHGDGLLLFGNNVRVPLSIVVNPLRLDLLSTNREQQQAVAVASGRKIKPVL